MGADLDRRCNVCGDLLRRPLYRSPEPRSLTSLCETWPGETIVYRCDECGHLQTNELPGIDKYYDHEYNILVESVDDDQIYRVINGVPVFRTDHQVATLMEKVHLRNGALVLDYGCAKGAGLRKLCGIRPDVVPHLFDVSSNYLPFWRQFAVPANWATYTPRPEWNGRFDLVTSFYALEHMADPASVLRVVRTLLAPNGVFYGVVPNVRANAADFVVADHVNHFTRTSLLRLFFETGFEVADIDDTAHDGALVFSAVEMGSRSGDPPRPPKVESSEIQRLAEYWMSVADKVRAFEESAVREGRCAIYGSGFYGTFIASCLRDVERVECFVDQNPHRQGRRLLDRPIVAPQALPEGIGAVYVGLNPREARQSIAEVNAWSGRSLRYFFL